MSDAEIFNNIQEMMGKAKLRDWSEQFHRYGIITVTEMLPLAIRQQITSEAESLLKNHAERRDLTLATTEHSPRMMSVVHSEIISEYGNAIPSIAKNKGLLSLLETIAGESLFHCQKMDEEYLISRHERQGDTHGWHWGDFSFALIWVLRAPPIDVGGLLQCIPHTNWDKSSPKIHQYMVKYPINTYYFASGDVYFLRTDTTLHRTIPLRSDATRIMLNMTWASQKDLTRNIAGEDRWWSDADAQAAVAMPSVDVGNTLMEEVK